MHHYSVKSLAVTLRPSRQLAALLGLAGVACSALSAVLPVPVGIRVLLVLAVLLSMGYAIAHQALRRMPWSIDALEVGADNVLRVHLRRDGWREAQVLDSSYVTPWLVVVHLRLEGARLMQPVTIIGDMADRDALRRLRVWMKWGRAHADAST